MRFPDLKVAYSEGQIGWIPYILERADRVWEDNRGWGGVADIVPEKPSSYFKDHVWGCFFDDAHGLRSVDEIGEDNITYESDYPHSDSTWPRTAADRRGADGGPDRRAAAQDRARQRDQAVRPRLRRLTPPRSADAWTSATPRPNRRSALSCGPGWPRRSPASVQPPPHDDWAARRAYDLRWQRTLFDAGYAGVDWPAEGGGRGASPVEQLIFKEECERAGAPYVGVSFVGLLHAGPTVIAEGTPAQRERYLPAILRGEEVWCQGFSEPDAGSDLASLRTRAVRDGDDYVVTGSKIWTSHAEVADFCELLVRTGDEGNRGISWLIMPMDSPGIEIRPLRTIEGTTEFAQLFLNEVRIPVANRVGEENDGWRVTMVTLSFERGTAFVGELLECMRLLGELHPVGRPARPAGRRRPPPAHRAPRGRLRRAVGAHQAQRLGGRPDRCPRHRRVRVQAVVLRARPGAG